MMGASDDLQEVAVDADRVVKALHEVDPAFVALCDTLYGPGVDAGDVWQYIYKTTGVVKMSPGPSDVHSPAPIKAGKGVLVPKPPPNGARAPRPVTVPPPAPTTPTKAMPPAVMGVRKELEDDEDGVDVVWSGEFSKFDDDKRQAFGWASVVEVGGQPVVDLQGDWITPDELEKAAYHFVRKSRVGGSQHARDEDGGPMRAGDMIESMVFTDEKYAALAKSMDLPLETFADAPRAWWTGFEYDDDATWADIKSGRKTGFSVHGRGKRQPAVLPA